MMNLDGRKKKHSVRRKMLSLLSLKVFSPKSFLVFVFFDKKIGRVLDSIDKSVCAFKESFSEAKKGKNR